MGFFRRSTDAQETPAPAPSTVREAAYRRLGHAMATVAVTLEPSGDGNRPAADSRLTIRNDAASVTLAPVMLAHEVPGTRQEAHRLWFVTELSRLMFEDGEFTLLVNGAAIEMPHPIPEPALDSEGDDEPPELRAAVAELEERLRAADRANAELNADARRMSDVVAATLAEVQREREQLLELVAQTRADLEHTAGRRQSADAEPAVAEEASFPNRELLARLGAARGASGQDDRSS